MTRPALFAPLLLSLLFLSLPRTGRAQTPPAPQGPPDVLILVSQRPTGGDLLNLTYGKTVPRSQVDKDLAALSRETGWALGTPTITDAPPAVQPSRQKAIGRMTGVVVTTPQAVQAETHSFPINALASAFRGYRRIGAVFFTAPGFSFQGPRAYADKNVRVTVAGSGTSYTCQIEILDPGFTTLNLPLSQPVPASARPASRLPALLAIVGAAAGVGLLVYFLLARSARRGPETPAEALPEEAQDKFEDKGRKTPA